MLVHRCVWCVWCVRARACVVLTVCVLSGGVVCVCVCVVCVSLRLSDIVCLHVHTRGRHGVNGCGVCVVVVVCVAFRIRGVWCHVCVLLWMYNEV